MALEKGFLRGFLSYMPGLFRRIYTIVLIFVGWVFFFCPRPGEAFSYLQVMFGFSAYSLIDSYGRYILVSNIGLMIILIMGLIPGVYRSCEKIFDRGGRVKAVISGILYGALFVVCIAYMVTGVHQPFLYLRF